MENSVAEGQYSETYGGFLVSIDSIFNITTSIIGKASSGDSCVIFSLGKHTEKTGRNTIKRVNIRDNNCESSLI